MAGKVYGQGKSEKFPIGKGVGQGDTIYTKLFVACLKRVFRKFIGTSQGYD